MAGKNQKELEIVLTSLEIPSLKGMKLSTHILQVGLLWPRCAIAQKNSEKEVELLNGSLDWSSASWCRKILFKEVVTSRFGLELGLTTSLSRTELANFGRFIAGHVLGIGSDEVEDRLPAGELASLPLLYFSKNLLKNKLPELIIKGNLDLTVEQFSDSQALELEIPLFSERELVRQQRLGGRKGLVKYNREILLNKGAQDGVARIQFRVLE